MRAFWDDSHTNISFVIADGSIVTTAEVIGFIATNNVFDVTSLSVAKPVWGTMYIFHIVDYENGHSLVLPIEDIHIGLLNMYGRIRLEVWDESEEEFTLNNYFDRYYAEY